MTFYKFAPLCDTAVELEAMSSALRAKAAALTIRGTILLAEEGINGTVSGSESQLRSFEQVLREVPGLVEMPVKYSRSTPDNPVFYRLKVRVKPEIVALGHPGVKPAERTGTHVDAESFNALLDDPDVLVIDTRNSYEIAIGSFPGAVNPGTRSFRQFPQFAADLDHEQHPRVAMFCTGGIRCEKASAYLLSQGFESVFQLDGGILKYLETVEPQDNRWQGECFVFDQRVSVDAELNEGTYEQCFACRHPLSADALADPRYQTGVSCPHCFDAAGPARREGFRERQRQVELAASRGESHVGRSMPSVIRGTDAVTGD